MRLEKCWFCSSTVYPGHGIAFVRNDCTVFKFCRSKCHKNFKMKRNPRKLKWTKAYRLNKNKELAGDAVFQMERKRNRPEKYNRNLVRESVKAMEKIAQVREARQDRFYQARMAKGKQIMQAAAKAEVANEVHLVQAPAALLKQNQQAEKQPQKEKLRIPVEAPQRAIRMSE